jgi:hypothetical protein
LRESLLDFMARCAPSRYCSHAALHLDWALSARKERVSIHAKDIFDWYYVPNCDQTQAYEKLQQDPVLDPSCNGVHGLFCGRQTGRLQKERQELPDER